MVAIVSPCLVDGARRGLRIRCAATTTRAYSQFRSGSAPSTHCPPRANHDLVVKPLERARPDGLHRSPAQEGNSKSIYGGPPVSNSDSGVTDGLARELRR